MLFFRRTRRPAPRATARPPRPQAPTVEYIGITLDELRTFEQILLHADERVRHARPELGYLVSRDDLIGRLYESAGAASVLQPDPELVRVPVQHTDFLRLETAIRDIEMYRGDPRLARIARQLLNRCHALLGQSRAVIHMGGTPVFTPGSPAPAAPELRTRPETA
ncbi:hypothetical protein [Streptomyces sp. NPDC088915]|uniref:hypothetical protein n=1 Tax=Streptomyces sp. NPDC088915 TaxID=3365912 RepID=UPI003808F83A